MCCASWVGAAETSRSSKAVPGSSPAPPEFKSIVVLDERTDRRLAVKANVHTVVKMRQHFG
jgi:hypothetical protein